MCLIGLKHCEFILPCSAFLLPVDRILLLLTLTTPTSRQCWYREDVRLCFQGEPWSFVYVSWKSSGVPVIIVTFAELTSAVYEDHRMFSVEAWHIKCDQD
jgi:hypothetical protein